MFKISSGPIARPQRVVLYGVEGIGKTTLASQTPEPLFIDTEGGTAHLDVRRTQRPGNWETLLALIGEVANTPDVCKTLVIDTADWAEQMLVTHVLEKNEKKGIEDFGYGKGYVYLAETWTELLRALDKVIDAGIYVVVTAHAMMRKQELPDEAGAFDRYELKLTKKIAPLLKEWADALLFCNYKTIVVNVDGQGAQKGRNKAQGARRVIYTTHNACWDAKNRFGMPDELPMEYKSIAPIFKPLPKSEAPATTPATAKTPETPAPKPKPAPKVGSKSNPVAAAMPPVTAETLAILKGWMEETNIKPEHIAKLVAQKGHFSADVPIEQYPEAFVRGWLMKNWSSVVDAIHNDPDYIPF